METERSCVEGEGSSGDGVLLCGRRGQQEGAAGRAPREVAGVGRRGQEPGGTKHDFPLPISNTAKLCRGTCCQTVLPLGGEDLPQRRRFLYKGTFAGAAQERYVGRDCQLSAEFIQGLVGQASSLLQDA